MIGRLSILAGLLAAIPVLGSAKEPGKKPREEYMVSSHLFARSVGFDKQGHCRAVGGVSLKSWHVPGFPAEIPHFESCTTVSSSTTKGEVDFVFSIVDKDGERLQRVDGVLDLGEEGQASQAIDWDHLKIPSAGVYFFTIKIGDREVGRVPMRFQLRKAGRKHSRKKP